MSMKRAADFFPPGIVGVLHSTEHQARVEQVIAAIDLGARQAEEWAKRTPNKAAALEIQHNTRAEIMVSGLIESRILDRCFGCGQVYPYYECGCPVCREDGE